MKIARNHHFSLVVCLIACVFFIFVFLERGLVGVGESRRRREGLGLGAVSLYKGVKSVPSS